MGCRRENIARISSIPNLMWPGQRLDPMPFIARFAASILRVATPTKAGRLASRWSREIFRRLFPPADCCQQAHSGVILSAMPVRLGPKDVSYLRNVFRMARSLDFARDDIANISSFGTELLAGHFFPTGLIPLRHV